MKKLKTSLIIFIVLLISTAGLFISASQKQNDDDRFITYEVNVKKSDLRLYWKDDNNVNFKSIQHLKTWLEDHNQTLLFAMNAGMYKPDNSPQGLYIENKELLSPLDTTSGNGELLYET